MSLDNLARTVPPMLTASHAQEGELAIFWRQIVRHQADAKSIGLSVEGRFEALYPAALQIAISALLVCGYRLNNVPGHHQTAFNVLPESLGVERSVATVCNAFRNKRNIGLYEGDLRVTETEVDEFERLVTMLSDRLREKTTQKKS